MDQAPNCYHNYMPTQFDPPPQQYMGEQFQQQYHGDYNLHEHEQHQPAVDPFMDAVNAEVWAAVQAYHSKDAKSLHLAYANIGFVLGVDKACTYFVRSYSSANPSYGGAHSRRTAKLFFKKDWENLEAMVAADIDNEKKIVHVEEFMKRRRIPGYVSLHAPKQIVCEKLQVKQEQISRVDDACHTRDEVMRLDVACQTRDESTISLNVACQTEKFRSLEASCQTEKFVSLETSCQTECLVSLDIARQTVDKSAGLSVSCQTTDTCDKSSQTSVDKAVRKESDNRKRAHDDEQDSRGTKRSKHSDSSRKSNDEIVRKGSSDNCKRDRGDKSETCSTNRSASRSKHSDSKCSSQKRESVKSSTSKTHAVDSKKSSRESSDKNVSQDSSDNYKYIRGDESETSSTDRSESHAKRSNSKDSAQQCEATKSSASKNVSRQTTDAVDSKKSSRDSAVTFKVLNDHKDGGGVAETKRSSSDCKEHSGSYGCHVTMLVIQNLHPLVNDADISTIFSVFKSYKSSKVNSHNYGKMGVAGVVFEEEADAQEAKKQFNGKKLDGYPMHIVVVKSEKN